VDLLAVADELYGLLPGEFTVARNNRAREARRQGDKVLAEQLGRLPKPSASAWVVNMLVRRRADEISRVLELGETLRQAQEDLDREQLRLLTRQRQELIRAVAQDARALVEGLGHTLSVTALGEVEQTLQSAMADAEVAAAVGSGMLTRGLTATGWEETDLSGAVAVPRAPESWEAARLPGGGVTVRRSKNAPERGGAAKAKTERLLAEKRRRQAEALEAADKANRAQEALRDAEDRIRDIAEYRVSLERELNAVKRRAAVLEGDLAGVDREAENRERIRDKAVRAAATAQQTADRAHERLDGSRPAHS
jgi:hypothetical protein